MDAFRTCAPLGARHGLLRFDEVTPGAGVKAAP
jgi:hypothetical protein